MIAHAVDSDQVMARCDECGHVDLFESDADEQLIAWWVREERSDGPDLCPFCAAVVYGRG